MKKKLIIFMFSIAIYSCNSNPENENIKENPEKENIILLLKGKIGNQLPFNEVKIAQIENGTGVIVDKSWCYWIDSNNKIYCVNGSSKSVYNVNNPKCQDAPIKATFGDIDKIAK